MDHLESLEAQHDQRNRLMLIHHRSQVLDELLASIRLIDEARMHGIDNDDGQPLRMRGGHQRISELSLRR